MTLRTLALRFLAIAALAFVAAAPVLAEDRAPCAHYVDALSGDDHNSGDEPDKAWRTLDRVNSASLQGGDSVLFRRGQLWRGTLRAKHGEEGRPVTYGAYGEGEKPRIMSSADLSSPDLWSLDEETGLWATPVDSYADEPGGADFSGFASGGWHVYREEDAQAKCSERVFEDLGGAKGWRVECSASGSKPSFLQLTTEGFPVRSGHFVALRFRFRSSVPFSIGTSVPKLMMRGKPWSGYGETVVAPGEIGTDWVERDVVFRTTADAEDGRITFFLGGRIPEGAVLDFVPLGAREVRFSSLGLGTDVGNLVLTELDAVPGGCGTGALKKFPPTYDRREYAGFKKWTAGDVRENGDFWYDLDTRRVFMKCEGNPGERFDSIEGVLRGHCCQSQGSDIVFEGLTFSHTGAHGISVVSGERVVVRDCDFDWIGGGDLRGGGGSGERVRFGNGIEFWDGSIDCLVEQCRFSRIYDVATTTQGPGDDVSRNLVIRDCVMFRCEQAFEIWFTSPETVVEGLRFERNLCVDCGREWSHVQRPNKIATPILGYRLEAKKVDITIRENVFYDTAQYFIKHWHNRIGDYAIDDNVYWTRPEGAGAEHYQGDRYFVFDASRSGPELTWDEYRKTTGQDAHSRWLEPKFRDAARDDFELLNRDELGAGPVGK